MCNEVRKVKEEIDWYFKGERLETDSMMFRVDTDRLGKEEYQRQYLGDWTPTWEDEDNRECQDDDEAVGRRGRRNTD